MIRHRPSRLRTRFARLLRETWAPWLVQDSYGTYQRCWTYREALGWLSATSEQTRIVNLITGRITVFRNVGLSEFLAKD